LLYTEGRGLKEVGRGRKINSRRQKEEAGTHDSRPETNTRDKELRARNARPVMDEKSRQIKGEEKEK
jgi:hypothetical protein